MLTLPLFRLLVIRETSLLTAKFRGVHVAAPVHVLAGDELVQHLMEDNIFDHVAWDEGLVQEAVYADQPVALLVGTKAYGRTLALGRSATPGNVRLHAIDEVAVVEIMIDRSEVKITPSRLQRTGTLQWRLEAGKQGLLLPYIGPYGLRSAGIGVAQICHEGTPDPLGRLTEYLVQTHLIPRRSITSGGQHRRPIVRPYQRDVSDELSTEPGLSVALVNCIRRDQ